MCAVDYLAKAFEEFEDLRGNPRDQEERGLRMARARAAPALAPAVLRPEDRERRRGPGPTGWARFPCGSTSAGWTTGVAAGLYSLGNPSAEAPVFVTANYKLFVRPPAARVAGDGCLAARARHPRGQRLVRGGQGHVLHRGTCAAHRGDGIGRRRFPPAADPAATSAWSARRRTAWPRRRVLP